MEIASIFMNYHVLIISFKISIQSFSCDEIIHLCLLACFDKFFTRLMRFFKTIAYSCRGVDLEANYDKLTFESRCAKEFVDSFSMHHWANVSFQSECYGNMYSNVIEFYNAWIIEARHLPICELVDHIRIQIMEICSRKKIQSSKWMSHLCLSVEEKL